MRRGAVLLVSLLTACSPARDSREDDTAGRALEVAARHAGIVSDVAEAAGVYAVGEDRLCLTGTAPRYRIGVSVDFGEGQRCLAHGSAQGRGDLAIDFGDGCRFTATRNGDRLLFPVRTPAACARSCQGRATLDTLAFDRLSEASGEASRLRGADGKLLCAD
ncbi:hypothetical protein [Sphingomonas phyllosphaerae]|uniref:hypothetical protein n=1 Tax=Sphingomonas phyllosphaerae TaxID=257003 RepID=UPI0003F587D3|nr:hypothetical protein [Sphingomonas phyllosphaerae]